MVEFEYFFLFCALLLAIVVLTLARGLLRIHRASQSQTHHRMMHVHVWPLTFLLMLFVLADVAAWWAHVWFARPTFVPNFRAVVAMPVLIALYYFAASMVFPSDRNSWLDLNGWFWINRRPVLASIAAAALVWLLVSFRPSAAEPFEIANLSLYAAGLLVASATRKHRLAAGALALLIVQRIAATGFELFATRPFS